VAEPASTWSEPTYLFPSAAEVRSRVTPGIEHSELVVTWRGFADAAIVPLLPAAERAAFSDAVCGIHWDRPERESSAGAEEVVYPGDVCNGRASVRTGPDGARSLSIRSAC
jgi:hypothetical protein